jgi:signal recognition particle subunit SEC65
MVIYLRRWVCVYPAYLDDVSVQKGRRVNKELAVKDPPIVLMAEAVRHLNLECIVEVRYTTIIFMWIGFDAYY